MPSGRSSVSARPDAAQGKRATVTSRFCFCASVSVRPHQASSGIREDDGRDGERLERDALAGNRLDRDAALVRRLVRQHRLADDVADRVDRRLGRAPRARRPR